MKKFSFHSIFVLFFLCLFSRAFPQKVFILTDTNNQEKLVHIKGQEKTRVFVFLSPECPLCQNYTLTLNNLFIKYKEIEIIGILSSKSFNTTELQQFIKKYHILFPVYLNNLSIAKHFDATITPEVVVTNSFGEKIYQGRIDNWAYDIGKKRKQATVFDLVEILNKVKINQNIAFTRTKAIGCLIE
jgi:hypothetical protein